MHRRTPSWKVTLAVSVMALVAVANAAHGADIRIAVIPGTRSLETEADVLEVALSHQSDVALLERGEIRRILGEQAQSFSTAADCLRAGTMLRADGVIVLRRVRVEQQELIVADLMAVGLGYRLDGFTDRYPAANLDKWVEDVQARFGPQFNKLQLQPANVIPLSFLSVRAAAGTTDAKVLERSLNYLLPARMLGEPRVIVLERQHLGSLEFEKDFIGAGPPPQWTTARFVVDGELLPAGPDPDRVSLQLRIEPRNGAKSIPLSFNGTRQQLGMFVDQVAAGILSSVGQPSQSTPWRSLEEAQRFSREAFSAERAGLEEEALAAGEASHALGCRTDDLLALIARQSCLKAFPGRGGLADGYESSRVNPAAVDIGLVQHALELANSQSNARPGLDVLLTAARVIRFYRDNGAYDAHRQDLESLRTLLRSTTLKLSEKPEAMLGLEFCGFLGCYAPYLFDDPGQVLDCYQKVLQQTLTLHNGSPYPYAIARVRHYMTEARDTTRLFGLQSGRTPWLVGWHQETPAQLDAIWNQFLARMSVSTNVNDQLDSLLFRLYTANDGAARTNVAHRICDALWLHRDAVVSNLVTYSISIQLLNALPSHDEAFMYKFFKYELDHATFYDYQLFERGLVWANDKGTFGFTTPELRGDLLKAMDDYGRRINGQRAFQSAEFRQFRQRLMDEGSEPPAKSSEPVLVLDRGWAPPAVEAPRFGLFRNVIRKVLYRDGQMWALRRGATIGTLRTNAIWMKVYQVDPVTFATAELDVPNLEPTTQSQLYDMDYDFEVSPEYVFIATQGKIIRYDRATREWCSLEVPQSLYPSLTLLGTRLYYAYPGHMGRWGRNDPASGILRINPKSLEQEVLASSRRKQPATLLDDVPAYKVPSLFTGPDGRLHAVVNFDGVRRGENLKLFSYNESTHEWTPVLAGQLEGNKGRFGLQAFPQGDGTLFQRLQVTANTAEFSVLKIPPDGQLETLIAPGGDTPAPTVPWRSPESPWDYTAAPPTPLVASRDGREYWALLKDFNHSNGSLALFHYRPGSPDPTVIAITCGKLANTDSNLDPGLVATPHGLVLMNLGGAAFWVVPWDRLPTMDKRL